MAISAGNLSFFRISIELRTRVLLNPWFKKSSLVRCCRDYSSSGPVRYIPRVKDSEKPRGRKKSETMTKDDIVESNEFYDIVPLREYMVPEVKPAFGMSGSRAETGEVDDDSSTDVDGVECLEWDEEGGSVDVDMNEGGLFTENGNGSAEVVWKNKREAERIAIEALAKRAFTTLELRKKLLGKKISPVIIDNVLADFKNRGLINDYLYAESYSQSRWASSTWGPRRIKQALRQKGVSEEDAKKAMEHVFQGDEEAEGEKETNLGMSESSLERLIVQASKQWLRGQDVPLEKRKSRIVRWLQYRGFNWGVINFVVKKLESQYQP